MSIPCRVKEKLPRSALASVRWSFRHFYFAKFRLANAMQWQIGWMTITHRAPWLEASARALHPHLFDGAE